MLITNESELWQGLDDFKLHVESMQEPYKGIFRYYAENTRFISDPLQMSSIGYNPEKDAISYNARFFKFPQYQQSSTALFSHEFAHRFDVYNIQSWENSEFVNAIDNAMWKIVGNLPKYNRLYVAIRNPNPAFQDILGAISDNKINVQFSHLRWDAETRAMEIFANLSYLKSSAIEFSMFDGLLDDIVCVFERMFLEGV